jgi:hypothetical protein
VPVKRVIVVIDRCVIDGLEHEIVLDLDTVLVQGVREFMPQGPVERDVVLTCPTTGRGFRATIPLPEAPGEMITNVTQAPRGDP